MRIPSRLLILALTAALLGCGGDESSCQSDSDCKGERICSKGSCADPGSQETVTTGSGSSVTSGGGNGAGSTSSGIGGSVTAVSSSTGTLEDCSGGCAVAESCGYPLVYC